MSKEFERKQKICTDNIDHYISEISSLINDLKKFRDVPSWEFGDDIIITDTVDLYLYIKNEIEDILVAIDDTLITECL